MKKSANCPVWQHYLGQINTFSVRGQIRAKDAGWKFTSLHLNTVSVAASVPTAAAPLPNISQSLWMPLRLEQLLSQHYLLSCLSPSQNTTLKMTVFFLNTCQYFSFYTVGVLCHDLRWGVIDNICPISSHSGRKQEREEEGESHSWNSPEPVCKQMPEVSMKGKGHI